MRARAAVADVELLDEEMPSRLRQSASLLARRDIDAQFECPSGGARLKALVTVPGKFRDAKQPSAIRLRHRQVLELKGL